MKKTIILWLALVLGATFNYSFGRTPAVPVPLFEQVRPVTLIINANVNVVLVDNEKAPLKLSGDDSFLKQIVFKTSGDTLVINGVKNKDLKKTGTIYVPASQLRRIRVNSEARIQTLRPLQIPVLDVIINGACSVSISNVGEVNLVETDNYYFLETTEVRHKANIF